MAAAGGGVSERDGFSSKSCCFVHRVGEISLSLLSTSDSYRRKKVDLKTKLQIRAKGLCLPSPLLCRRTSELKGRLLFVKQIASNWRASSA